MVKIFFLSYEDNFYKSEKLAVPTKLVRSMYMMCDI